MQNRKLCRRQCSDHAYFGVGEEWKEEDFVHHLSDAEGKGFEKELADLIRKMWKRT